MIEVIKALQEAEISVACLQDDNFESKKELDKDLEHISNQIAIAINILKEQDNEYWQQPRTFRDSKRIIKFAWIQKKAIGINFNRINANRYIKKRSGNSHRMFYIRSKKWVWLKNK